MIKYELADLEAFIRGNRVEPVDPSIQVPPVGRPVSGKTVPKVDYVSFTELQKRKKAGR